MKLKHDFLVRKIGGENVLVPVGKTVSYFNGLIMINDMGLYIWENIEQVEDENEMLKKILSEYEIDEKTAKSDMEEFLDTLRKADII